MLAPSLSASWKTMYRFIMSRSDSALGPRRIVSGTLRGSTANYSSSESPFRNARSRGICAARPTTRSQTWRTFFANHFGDRTFISPVMFADMIYDTSVSPVPSGLRGSIYEHHMRFISREFDIHVKLTRSDERTALHGQLSANGVAPKSSLVTLLFNHGPLATTVADPYGEFKLEQIPSGEAMLEILVPSRRIVAAFDVSPR